MDIKPLDTQPSAACLQLAGIPRSPFYYMRLRLDKPDKDHELKELIASIFHRHQALYGYRRIKMELMQRYQLAVNHKKILRLMAEMELVCRPCQKKYASYKGPAVETAPNLVGQNFKAGQPQEKCTTDISEFKVAGEKLYLSPVLDMFNGEILSYTIDKSLSRQLVLDMLDRAFPGSSPRAQLTLHSDQGWHYRTPAYRRELAAKGITQSMSRKGNCLDNAIMEAFLAP